MRATLLPLFLLFSFAAKTLVGEARPDPVFDTSGQKLRVGIKYFILPVIRGRGGGLTLGSNGNNTCPLYVVQENQEVFNGLPVTFSTFDGRGVIHTSNDLNIKTSASTICVQSTVWRLLKELTGVWFVSTGGVEGNPGFETITNWFKIEKADEVYNDYHLVFCPTVSKSQTLCRELGLFTDDQRKKHLALSDQIPPFRVVFQRVSSLSSSDMLLNKAENI